eukprot:TRINITY_DN619_c0_g1_i17.p1 TRINITY_DN619_c0_g1~~TRINITY_DN619_c0_g1_i17.p1  ORF type:complete len:112 (+),score=14.19 TRINITY_DN619_c0_g1_i17:381-716(+)
MQLSLLTAAQTAMGNNSVEALKLLLGRGANALWLLPNDTWPTGLPAVAATGLSCQLAAFEVLCGGRWLNVFLGCVSSVRDQHSPGGAERLLSCGSAFECVSLCHRRRYSSS